MKSSMKSPMTFHPFIFNGVEYYHGICEQSLRMRISYLKDGKWVVYDASRFSYKDPEIFLCGLVKNFYFRFRVGEKNTLKIEWFNFGAKHIPLKKIGEEEVFLP